MFFVVYPFIERPNSCEADIHINGNNCHFSILRFVGFLTLFVTVFSRARSSIEETVQ